MMENIKIGTWGAVEKIPEFVILNHEMVKNLHWRPFTDVQGDYVGLFQQPHRPHFLIYNNLQGGQGRYLSAIFP